VISLFGFLVAAGVLLLCRSSVYHIPCTTSGEQWKSNATSQQIWS